jgi:signal transduction histidine kinase
MNLLAIAPSRNLRGFWNAAAHFSFDYGTGVGRRISRSIVEAHGGRRWAADNSPRGASLYFALPNSVEAHE